MPAHFLRTRLLATDQQNSVLSALDANRPHPIAYSPYGHRPPENGLLSLLGFNGELPEPLTGHYLLGNGFRAFNPVLMRFNSPDSWSPFGEGGINAYCYCTGDPRNNLDLTGHTPVFLKNVLRAAGLMKKPVKNALSENPVRPSVNNPTQRNTTKNLIGLTPADGRPAEMRKMQIHLETNRLEHAGRLNVSPQTTDTRSMPPIYINQKPMRPLRAYSKIAANFHNRENLEPFPIRQRHPKVTFSDSLKTVFEVERLVEPPVAGWMKVTDIRK